MIDAKKIENNNKITYKIEQAGIEMDIVIKKRNNKLKYDVSIERAGTWQKFRDLLEKDINVI